MTQAAISHQVKALEEYLEVKLFRRLNRALRLTDEGQAYAPALTEAFQGIRSATRSLHRLRDNAPLTVSVIPSLAARWLVPRLGRYRALHPESDLLIAPSLRLVDLSQGEVDIAIRYGRGEYPGLETCRLMGEDLFPVCSPELLTGSDGLKTPSDLAQVPLLHDDNHEDWLAWLRAAGIADVPAERGTVFTDGSILVEAAIAGQGVALSRGALVDEALRTGTLVRPFPQTLTTDLAYYVVCLPERALEPRIMRFREWLLAEAAATG